MSLLSDKRIIEELEKGNIVIEPFDQSQLGTNSFDVRLGRYYYIENPSNRITDAIGYTDFWSQLDSEWAWIGPFDALGEKSPSAQVRERNGPSDYNGEFVIAKVYEQSWLHGIGYSPGYIMFPPGQTVLCHTVEIVGGRNKITTSMRARSSIGRIGLCTNKAAGLGDVGYVSRWTMEISNHALAVRRVPVGARVAQMEFYNVGETLKVYQGKYGSETDWQPSDMLPKLYKDRDRDIIGRNWKEEDIREAAVG